MLTLFNTTLPSSNTFVARKKVRETSDLNLCSCLDNDDLGILARCCNEAQIFSEVINASDLLSLLEGKMTMPLISSSVTGRTFLPVNAALLAPLAKTL